MTTSLSERFPVRGRRRILLRLPIWLYHVHLGWLLGNRFLLLTHIGRRSGRPRQTVLEVIRHDPATDNHVIASGWGERADWLLNIQQAPNVGITVWGRRLAMVAERLASEEAATEFSHYARRHPIVFRHLAPFLFGQPIHGTAEDMRRLARSCPVVALRPRTR